MSRIKQFCSHIRTRYVLLFSVIVELIYIGFLGMPTPNTEGIQKALGLSEDAGWYVDQILCNLGQIIVMILILYLINQLIVLRHKGVSFGRTIILAAFLLVVNILQGAMSFIGLMRDGELVIRPMDILVFVICMLLVGIAEEMCFRGLIGTAFLKKFGTSRKGIWCAVTVTSLLFGLTHLVNLYNGADLGYTITQVIGAACGGALLMAVYLRSGNFWACAFLHGFNDVMVGIGTVMVQSPLLAVEASHTGFDLRSIFYAVVTQLLPAIYLLRKTKIAEVQQRMQPILEET